MRTTRIGKYTCEHCHSEQSFSLSGENERIVKSMMDEAVEYAQNQHWYAVHHVCAVCGKILQGTDYDLVINDGSIRIHPEYSHYYGIRIKEGDSSFCLGVHKRCLA